MGGLGNQLFQYALGRQLAVKNNIELELDLTWYENNEARNFNLDKFNTTILKAKLSNIPYKVRVNEPKKYRLFISKIFGSRLKFRQEERFNFNQKVLNYTDKTYLWGYWQSEKYFVEIKEVIKKEFQFKEKIKPELDVTALSMRRYDSVCLHIRRGDYVNNLYHNTLTLDYYQEALNIVTKDLNNPKVFVFSDDIPWCIENLNIDFPHEFISGNEDWEDLKLMTLCKHNIIANSSFSWWGAYLGIDKEKKIIAPKEWFPEHMGHNTNDLILKDWIRL